MSDEAKSEKRRVGRPPKPMPELIPDSPENIALALLRTPPKKEHEWRYLQNASGEPESEASEDNEETDRR